MFHEACLSKWGKNRCPLCRAKQLLMQDTPSQSQTATNRFDLPDTILRALYNSYTERLWAVLNWLSARDKDNSSLSFQWQMVKDSITALTEEDFCFIRVYEPEEGRGFMFDNNPRMNDIGKKVDRGYNGHSGSSYGWTMRVIQYLVRLV
jgi:hypothetical protein